jgi:hypothetical protein
MFWVAPALRNQVCIRLQLRCNLEETPVQPSLRIM